MRVNVRPGGRMALLAFVVAGPLLAEGADSPKRWDGLYVGIDLGRHNVIGGSQVDGVDVLQQDMRGAVTFLAGFRKQLGAGFVVGAEAGYGRVDGDLQLSDPGRDLLIDYGNDSQHHFGLILGHTLGRTRRMLLFAYLNELSRSFDVTIQAGSAQLQQHDEQGLLRYGIGAEVSLTGPLGVRATAGSSRAKFEGPTNIVPATELEASVGFVLQF